MDRVKRLSFEVLENNRNDFGTNFADNKIALNKISTIRSKMLKNELAGFITKFIKKELRNKKEKEERAAMDKQLDKEESEFTGGAENDSTGKDVETPEQVQSEDTPEQVQSEDNPKETS